MTVNLPELMGAANLQLTMTNPKHLALGGAAAVNQGQRIIDLQSKIGAAAALGSTTFESSMLSALDKVSAYQQFASALEQQSIIDPDSVDIQDITIAQAEASMSLNIATNILSRLVQGWKDILNTR